MTENTFVKMVEAPAIALEKAVDAHHILRKHIKKHPHIKTANEYWETLGPGLITGAADDDPSGIATYSQTGAQYGFQLLWLSSFTFPLMAIVQEMCARIGLATGRGLAGNIRINFSKRVLYTCTILLFITNALNIGADLGAMAKATELLIPKLNFDLLVVFFTAFSLILQIFTSYKEYAKYLKFLVLVLFSYVASALSINLNWNQIIHHTLIPSISFNKNQLFLICGILGTTISPYLFFWQTSQEIEEEILKGKTSLRLRQGTSQKEIKLMRFDVWIGMFISNMIMFFIIAATAASLYAHGKTNIQTAADAALALKPIAGNQAYLLFALGIIGTGLLAVPILAGSASYAFSESFRWKEGLYRKLKEARSFYGIIIISMMVGLIINFTGIDPIKALIYSAVLNGLVAPVILALIVLISSNKKIMDKHVNSLFITIIGWTVTGLMTIAGLATIISLLF